MRILVVSDSHGDVRRLSEAIQSHPEANMMIHLGDGERDLNEVSYLLGNIPLVSVRGNCDFYSLLPENELVIAGNKKIYCTHGHKENVKYGDAMLRAVAKSRNADIALYGHTHTLVTDYDDGLYIFNPGSIRDGRFGIIDILPSGIMCIQRTIL